jgi:hypothetical protein
MNTHFVNSLDNFIMGWYMKDTSLCHQIINYFDHYGDKKEGVVNLPTGSGVDKTKKDSIDCDLNNNPILFNLYMDHLSDCVEQYVTKYEYANHYGNYGVNENINIQKYNPGGGYKEFHTERTKNDNIYVCRRHLVFMTYLNDVQDKGETEFYHQQVKVKPEKGLTIIWPADWTFTHRGIVSPSQHKYIVTGWIGYTVDFIQNI